MYQWLPLALLCLSVLCQTLRADSLGPMSGPDLAAYLRSPSSDPKVCNQLREGSYDVVFTPKSASEWLSAFTTDASPNDRWQLCTKELLSSLPRAEADLLLDAMGASYRMLIRSPRFETDGLLRTKILILHNLFFDRKSELESFQLIETTLAKYLNDEITSHRLGLLAAASARSFIGEYRIGLRRLSELNLNNTMISRAWLEKNLLDAHGVLVRQTPGDNPPQTSVHLFKYRDTVRQIVSAIDLKDALHIEVDGLSRPVTLCSSESGTDSLEPTPCVSPKDVVIDHPLAKLHADGTLSLQEKLTVTQFLQLAKSKDGLVLPIRIGGKRWLNLSWNPYFQQPSSLVLTAQGEGTDGPTLWVLIDHRDISRFLISVVRKGDTRQILLDLSDAIGFQIVSQGAVGSQGLDGGNGGNGGRVYVEMICGDAECSHTRLVAQNIVRSLGGHGGVPASHGCVPLVPAEPCRAGTEGAPGGPGQVKFEVVAPGVEWTYED